MSPAKPERVVPNVLIINDDHDAAVDLRALLQEEGVSAHVLTMDSLATADAADAWMVQLNPIAIVIDIVAPPGGEYSPRLIGLHEAATRQHVPIVMTTRSKRTLVVPAGTVRIIEVADHNSRELLAACIARMLVPALRSERSRGSSSARS
jgi:hypothetical protein